MDSTYNIVPPDFVQTQKNDYANLPLQTGSRHNHHMVQRMKPLYTHGICSDLSPKIANPTNKKPATSIIQQQTHLFSHNVSDFGCL